MVTCSSILAWKNFMDKRSLVGYSPWGRKELDMTEHMHADTHTHTHTHAISSKPDFAANIPCLHTTYQAPTMSFACIILLIPQASL